MNTNEIFRRQLRAERKRKGYTQSQLGKLAGLTPAHVCHFEAGRRSPNLTNFRKLCVALDIDPKILLGYPPDKKPASSE